jgi:hypothetical protein
VWPSSCYTVPSSCCAQCNGSRVLIELRLYLHCFLRKPSRQRTIKGKWILKDTEREVLHWDSLEKDRDFWYHLPNAAMNFGFHRMHGDLLTRCITVSLKKKSVPWRYLLGTVPIIQSYGIWRHLVFEHDTFHNIPEDCNFRSHFHEIVKFCILAYSYV